MKSPEQIKQKLYEIAELNAANCNDFADNGNKAQYSNKQDKLDAVYDTLMWIIGACDTIELT